MRRNSQEFFVGLWFNGKGLQWDMRATLLTLSPIENENEIKFDGKKFKIVSFTSLISPVFTKRFLFHHGKRFSFHRWAYSRLSSKSQTSHPITLSLELIPRCAPASGQPQKTLILLGFENSLKKYKNSLALPMARRIVMTC